MAIIKAMIREKNHTHTERERVNRVHKQKRIEQNEKPLLERESLMTHANTNSGNNESN